QKVRQSACQLVVVQRRRFTVARFVPFYTEQERRGDQDAFEREPDGVFVRLAVLDSAVIEQQQAVCLAGFEGAPVGAGRVLFEKQTGRLARGTACARLDEEQTGGWGVVQDL